MPAKNLNAPHSAWQAGVARRNITPSFKIELAGLGYYLGRTGKSVRDHLNASALVISDASGNTTAILALDLMYGSAELTEAIRRGIATQTDIPPHAVCVNCSHSHNAPTAGFARGVGEMDPEYVRTVATQAIEATVQAWQERQPVRLHAGWSEVDEVAFNRCRENGPMDKRLGVLRVDTLQNVTLAVAINYSCHLNAHLDLDFYAISRDWAGELIDGLEAKMPGALVLFLQGSCGDIMVSPQFCATQRRFEVAEVISAAASLALTRAEPINGDDLQVASSLATLPTRRWSEAEIAVFREEGNHRLQTGDTTGWLEGIARHIVTYPHRLPLRYGGSVEKAVAAIARFAMEWSEAALLDLHQRPENLTTEVQAIRIGDVCLVANQAELYSSLALELRHQWPHHRLFILGYSNGAIGYLPDAFDIERHSYAADQSPKFTGQFPFTRDSGSAMVRALASVLEDALRK